MHICIHIHTYIHTYIHTVHIIHTYIQSRTSLPLEGLSLGDVELQVAFSTSMLKLKLMLVRVRVCSWFVAEAGVRSRGGVVVVVAPIVHQAGTVVVPGHTYILTYIHTYIHTYLHTYIHTYIMNRVISL